MGESVQIVPKKSRMTIMKNRHDEMPVDQHKATFTCPFDTFSYTRMPFGLCNAMSTFQRCMINIFSDLLEDYMEVFIDDFIVYAESFDACLENLFQVLCRCMDTNLVLNFEKCHFMVPEGIVLGHLVSSRGIEANKAKKLKKRLTSAPILQAPNWEYLFELMCDASSFMLGAILGQRVGK
ncbi:Retrovirus-related Pol polyprotein, partial [Mucuna pruriens]